MTAALLADMYETVKGSYSGSVSPDINGNLVERMQALYTLAGGFPGVPGAAAAIVGWTAPHGALHPAGGDDLLAYGPAATVAAVQYAYSSTPKMWQVGNDASAAQHYVRQVLGASDGILTPYGRGGVIPTYANPNGHLLPPNAATKCLVLEWYGKITAAFGTTVGSSYGIGFFASTGSTPFAAGSRHVVFGRKSSSNAWYVQTGDGTARSLTGGGTPDSNEHLFRLEWHPAEARLYVDGTLRATNSANLPAIDNSLDIAIVGWNAPNGAGADEIVEHGRLWYWKDAS